MAHFAATEARFRKHLRPISDVDGLVHLDDMLLLIEQNDVVQRRVFDATHRSFVPDFGIYIEIEDASGKVRPMALSRQLVLFSVERRKAWRMLQSKAGVTNIDYLAQKEALESFDADGVAMADRFVEIRERFDKVLANLS